MTSKPLITAEMSANITANLSAHIKKCVELQHALPQLVERAVIPSAGPTKRGSSEGRGSIGGHSDPTGEQAVTGWIEDSPDVWRYVEPMHDSFTTEVLAALKCLPLGHRWIEEAWSHAQRALSVPASDRVDEPPEANVCVRCAVFGVISIAEPGRTGSRCAACRKYRVEHQTAEGMPMDRPEALITAGQKNRKVREAFGVTILEPKAIEHVDPTQHHAVVE